MDLIIISDPKLKLFDWHSIVFREDAGQFVLHGEEEGLPVDRAEGGGEGEDLLLYVGDNKLCATFCQILRRVSS